MKIQANKNPLPPVESFTVTLTPREAVLLAALIGHTTRAIDRENIINSRLGT
jgi:DNA-binding response OmpR family regulator